jgi:heme o synthase
MSISDQPPSAPVMERTEKIPTSAVVDSHHLDSKTYFSVENPISLTKFAKAGLFSALILNLLAIFSGAIVRATGSGAGCSDHWPKCDGEIIPLSFTLGKAIEFSHRALSGLAMVGIALMAMAVFKNFSKGHPARISAVVSGILGLIECGIGALLVRFKLVEGNSTPERAFALSAHHLNTTLLLCAITLTLYWALGGDRIRIRNQGAVFGGIVVGAIGMVFTIVSGAISALGNTLFPALNHQAALAQSVNPAAHFLEHLRIYHPGVSVASTLFLVVTMTNLSRLRKTPRIEKWTKLFVNILVVQIVCGAMNIVLKAPLWMQVLHLALANAALIVMVGLCATLLSEKFAPVGQELPEPTMKPYEGLDARGRVKAFVALTKPRVISLLLFTTIIAMFIAKGGYPGTALLIWVFLGGYMMAGAANAINMVIDRDIDIRMVRTATRPTVSGVIPASHALLFALSLAGSAFVMLSLAANVLTATLAFAGLLFYVFIYTLLLKRRTWQNIVIGGAAGSFPPLVGYAAVTNNLSPLAWFLFALIFLWTPVHFWALALFIKDDYREAGIPMLPVVHGDRATVIQITAYAVLTAILCVLPVYLGQLGMTYAISAVLLNGLLVLRSWQLMQQTDRPHAVGLFKYSMVYLALIFVAMAVDRWGMTSL